MLMRLSRERPALTLAGLAPSAAAVRIPRTINLQPPVCLWGSRQETAASGPSGEAGKCCVMSSPSPPLLSGLRLIPPLAPLPIARCPLFFSMPTHDPLRDRVDCPWLLPRTCGSQLDCLGLEAAISVSFQDSGCL